MHLFLFHTHHMRWFNMFIHDAYCVSNTRSPPKGIGFTHRQGDVKGVRETYVKGDGRRVDETGGAEEALKAYAS